MRRSRIRDNRCTVIFAVLSQDSGQSNKARCSCVMRLCKNIRKRNKPQLGGAGSHHSQIVSESRFAEEIDILVISPDLVSLLQSVRIYGSVDFVVPPFALSDYCRFSIPGEHIYFDLFSCPGASSPPASDLIIYEWTVLH